MLEVIILAAGRGSRMHSDLPKVLHTLAGKPMLAHVMETATALSADRVHLVVGHGADQVKAVFADQADCHLQEQQLGTGHAVQQALPHCDPASTVLVLYGDVPLMSATTLSSLIAEAKTSPALLTARLDDPTGYGRVIRDQQGELVCVVEQKDASAEQKRINEVNTGVLAAPADLLADLLAGVDNSNAQGEYYLPDILALSRGRGLPVPIIVTDDVIETQGVNDRAQLEQLERAFQGRLAEDLMRDGVTLLDRCRIDVRGDLQCGRDVTIDANVLFEGRVSLADGVSIGANCVIKDANLGSGTVIRPFSHIDGAVIGANCTIGPYARLRPDTRLGDAVRIGNFVETKKTTLGAGSKANHLAYLGDSTLGESCNVGAGTITCNYDGANKHPTILGDDVFIGSNSTLVAPLTLAGGTFVAAGSTVTRATDADQLAVARARQRNIDGWKKPSKSPKVEE
ncbi:UDP-N-acetylglucosamine diphosphorylase/glucosamine-1-phosphate N-acetyltransferase [Luminiphilus syltensis NOR5-1B]|uniref:Bifunctional protein GlmU n=1 Tax=Luminiphilus syltensis NOR5-1B TaxID=565045 RepID=B8KUC8_9GAMM|nr:bifunctional UDP-N-acetylglucosamine diphosphorylase/glucosamine-1-phosphate N-acetyltransferase GlmU [Luminiphilus syltensis]EED36567.1 UDP-N-acetylglucosamine diphosphorylase/glucosamine-1-phosphate N-acetyltransferase [Luminiphilus syltensis NOR5-1B]